MSDDFYVVPVSGGKDSQLTLAEAVDAHGRDNVLGVYHPTGFDHPLTLAHLDYMRDRYGVDIDETVAQYADMRDLLDRRNAIPGRIARFCTEEFKIKAFTAWLDGFAQRVPLGRVVVLMGMRAAESRQRAENYGELSPDDVFSLRDLNPKKIPKRHELVRCQLPIVDRTTPRVYADLRNRGDRINPLYERGHTRVGCYPCILAGQRDYVLAAKDPIGRENVIMLRDFKALLVAAHEGKYEPEVIIEHDIDALLDIADSDPFGFHETLTDGGGCSWCVG
jgi:3'-phosphoadenosine 5'-phosphosulfate sulfotransferase (PAPS reductase)/FAD synthetase